jgi:hypothetical protein
MQRVILIVALLSLVGPNAWALDPSPTENLDSQLSHLPTNLKLKEERPQKYRITCDYLYIDTLGNPTGKDRVTGDYTRALPDGKVRWNNVRIAKAKSFDDPFPEGELQKYMEGFTYSLPKRENMLKPEFFPGFPANELKPRNLLWDMHMVEEFAWDHFSKLELNQPYAIQSKPEDVPLAGEGTFQNRRIDLTWVGLSKRNNEVCALIQYQAFMNKFNTAVGNITFQGRSHYWGDIWVSLKDRQIEHATLLEDVLVEFTLPGQQLKQQIGVLRKAACEQIGEDK